MSVKNKNKKIEKMLLWHDPLLIFVLHEYWSDAFPPPSIFRVAWQMWMDKGVCQWGVCLWLSLVFFCAFTKKPVLICALDCWGDYAYGGGGGGYAFFCGCSTRKSGMCVFRSDTLSSRTHGSSTYQALVGGFCFGMAGRLIFFPIITWCLILLPAFAYCSF